MSKKDKCIDVDKACGLSIIPEVDTTPLPCEDYISTECIVEPDRLVTIGTQEGDSQHTINFLINKLLRKIIRRLNSIENRLTNLENLIIKPRPFTVTLNSFELFTGANETIVDSRIIQGEQYVILTTDISDFPLVMISPIITSDGVLSVAIQNQEGESVILPNLNFKIINI